MQQFSLTHMHTHVFLPLFFLSFFIFAVGLCCEIAAGSVGCKFLPSARKFNETQQLPEKDAHVN